MVVERSLSNYSTMADMLGADGSSVVEACRDQLPAKAACCMRPDISQISISPSRLDQIVCRPSRGTQHAWDANLCCCHIRAAKLVVKGPLNQAVASMPTGGGDADSVRQALRQHAIQLGVSASQLAEATDNEGLRALAQGAKGPKQRTTPASTSAPPPMQFLPVPNGEVGPEYDQLGLEAMLTDEQLTSSGGSRVLCECVGCPLDNGSNSAHERFWVAEVKPLSAAEASMTLVPLSSVELPQIEPEPESEEDEETRWFYENARAIANERRRIRAANMIRNWWFWLWGDDIQWTMYTQKVANSDEGKAIMEALLESPKSTDPWFRGEVQQRVVPDLVGQAKAEEMDDVLSSALLDFQF